MYDVLNVADAILKIAKADGRQLTPMQLMKLTYIAHGWSLAFYDKDLFRNRIEAWQYGPVIPDLYHATKTFGRNPIPLSAIDSHTSVPLGDQDKRLLESVYQRYKHLDGISLSYLTHQSGTPWDQVYSHGVKGVEIPDPLIASHYKQLLNDLRAAQAKSE